MQREIKIYPAKTTDTALCAAGIAFIIRNDNRNVAWALHISTAWCNNNAEQELYEPVQYEGTHPYSTGIIKHTHDNGGHPSCSYLDGNACRTDSWTDTNNAWLKVLVEQGSDRVFEEMEMFIVGITEEKPLLET